jgi:hypothetical protein
VSDQLPIWSRDKSKWSIRVPARTPLTYRSIRSSAARLTYTISDHWLSGAEAPGENVATRGRMRFRKLRIAFSCICGIAVVLLCVLWVRSYEWRDRIVIPLRTARFLRVDSNRGRVEFETYGQGMGEMSFSITAISHADITAAWDRSFPTVPQPEDRKQWRWEVSRTGRFFVYLPYCFLVTILAALAAVPLIRGRFTTRTLLVAMTAVGVVLGFAVWAAR